MSEDRLTGLALMNIHKNMPVNIEEVIENFAREDPRRMKLSNIIKD